jgi:hypothetical protein
LIDFHQNPDPEDCLVAGGWWPKLWTPGREGVVDRTVAVHTAVAGAAGGGRGAWVEHAGVVAELVWTSVGS